MQRKKILKIILEVVIAGIVLLALIVGLLRAFFPYIDHYRPYFEQKLALAIHHPVQINKVNASWHGLYPTISLDNVVIYNDAAKTTEILKIKNFQIGINVLESLFTWQLKPSLFHITGTHLTIRQLDPQTFSVNGINTHFDAHQPKTLNIQNLLKLILSQGQIALDDIDVDWFTIKGEQFPVTNLKLKLSTGLFHNQLIGIGTLLQKTPARFRVVVNLHNNYFSSKDVEADAYLFIKNLDLSPWAEKLAWNNLMLRQGHIERMQLWASWGEKQLQQIQSVFELSRPRLFSQITQEDLLLKTLSGHALWQKNQNGWNFATDNLRLNIEGQALPPAQLSWQSVQLPNAAPLQIIRANQFNLCVIKDILPIISFLPDQLKQALEALEPAGEINDLLIRRETGADGKAALSASVNFAGIKILPWQHVPGVENLSGRLLVTPEAGELQLKGQQLTLNFGTIFHNPLEMDNYSGKVTWLKTDDGLRLLVNNLIANDFATSVRANMNLFIPQNGGSPYIQLLGSFYGEDARQIPNYLPVGLWPADLVKWLDSAFISGKSIQGELLLQGPLKHFPFDDNTGRFEIAAHIADAGLHYAPEWPQLTNVNADFLLDRRYLQVATSRANTVGIPLNPILAEIHAMGTPQANLNIHTSVDANVKDGFRFISASPLQKILGPMVKNIDWQGPAKINLGLEIPLQPGEPKAKVTGDVTFLPGGKLTLPAANIVLEQIQGLLHFTEQTVNAENLQGQWLGQPLTIQVSSKAINPDEGTLNVRLASSVQVAALQKNFALDEIANFAQGATNFIAQLQVNKTKNRENSIFMIDSDLQGIALNLPPPLKKLAEEKVPAHVQITLPEKDAQPLVVLGNYANKLSAAITLKMQQNKQYAFSSGQIRFGATPAVPQATPGWLINGEIANFNWSEVDAALSSVLKTQDKKPSSTTAFPLNKIDLNIGQLEAFGMAVAQANIQAQPLNQGWLIKINSPTIIGNVVIPANFATAGIRGEFEKFILMPGASKAVAGINPGKIPPLNLLFRDFSYADKALGRIALMTRPRGNTLQIDQLTMTLKSFNLTAKGQWVDLGNGRQQTLINGNVKTDDMGSVLQGWGITKSMEGAKGSATFAFTWPSAAYDFAMGKLNGNFAITLQKGRILDISGESSAEMGVGRVLNLFSLQSLPRRLSLDFSDLTKSGFSFDTMKGDFVLHSGDALTNNTLVNGPIAKVAIKGRIGLGAKDYNLLMEITPYVTSSIPVVATLVGGPIAGAAAWIGNKIFGGMVNQISSHLYKVSGGWADPDIEKISDARTVKSDINSVNDRIDQVNGKNTPSPPGG